jgi:hypothetical protein
MFPVVTAAPARRDRAGLGGPRGTPIWTDPPLYLLIRCVENIPEKENSRVGKGMVREDLFDSKIPGVRV